MNPGKKNSFNCLKSININGSDYYYYSIAEAEKNGLTGASKLPKSLKVLLENLLRYEDGLSVTKNQILKLHFGQQEFYYKIIQEFLQLLI